jgi:hypothetical protein
MLAGSVIETFYPNPSITCLLTVFTIDMNTGVWLYENRCDTSLDCNVVYSLEYTPLLYHLTPAVTYYGADLGIIIDPK